MVFVFGTICIDRIRKIERLPAPGGYVEVDEEHLLLGGEAANTAASLIEWGSEVRLAGNDLGCSRESELLEQLMREKRLPMDLLRTGGDERRSPVCDVYITPDGERTMFGLGFAAMNPSRPIQELPFVAGKWFTAEPNMGQVARDAVQAAHEAGMRTYLMDFIREDEPIHPGSVWQSSRYWTGLSGDISETVEWVSHFVERQGCLAIVTDGAKGLVAGSPESRARHFPPFPTPVVVDHTGAGDMFRAGMLHGLDRSWALPDCLRFAAAAGSLKCKGLGATGYIPSVDEVHTHIAAHPEISGQYD